jgi:hypothetical protein
MLAYSLVAQMKMHGVPQNMEEVALRHWRLLIYFFGGKTIQEHLM